MTKLSDITGHTDPFSKATRIKKKKKSSEAKKFSREINKTNYVKKVFSESNKKHTDAAKAIERRVEKRDKDKANGRDDDADRKNPYQNPDGTNKIALAGKRANFVPKQPYMPIVYVRLTKPGSTLQDNTFLELTLPPSNDPKSLSNGNIGLDMTVNRVASNNNPAGLTLQMTFADDTAILVEEALENIMKSPDKGDMGNPDSSVDQPKSNKTKKKNSSSAKNKSTSNKSKKESTSTKKSISFSIPNDPLAGVQTYAYKSSALSNLKKNSLGSFASGISKGISNFFGSFAAAGTTFGNPNNMYAEMGARQLAAANKAKKAKSSSKSKKSSDSSDKGKDKNKDKDSSDGSAQTKDTAGLDFYYGYSNSIRSQMYHCTIKDATVEFTAYGTRVTVQAVSTSTAEGAQPQFQFYSSGNPAEIVKEIAKRNGWDIGTINDTQTVYDGPQIAPAGGIAAKPKKGTKKKTYTQKGVGDIEFIRKTLAPDSRSSLNGDSDYVVWLTQGKDAPAINFAPKTQKAVLDKANGSGQPSSTYTFRWGSVSDTTVRSFTPDYSLSKSSFNPESVSASTLEKFSNAMFTTDYNKASSSWMTSFAPSISNHEDNYVLTMGGSTYTFQELEGASARMWYLNQNNSYTASMEIMGDPTLQPQNAIAVIIINPNGLPHHTSGIYLIKGITDSIQGGNYTSTLSLIKLPTSPDVGGPDGITGISVHKGDPQDNDGDGGSGGGKSTDNSKGDDPDGSASGKWVKPISGPWGTNCDGFGPNHPASGRKNNYHDGYDFGDANHGPYIRAAHEGYVEEIRENSTYCYYIAIKSGNIHHIYQEFTKLSQNIYVKKGQHVKTGQKIGKMGSGYSHLHFGINTKTWKESDTHPWGESGNHWKDPYKFIKSHK